ncbi:hypothetical protein DXG01_010805 [Tephrocybe rancida]|nr:hypothetical protein DXG01_010805 [Tephrocybe rancida]
MFASWCPNDAQTPEAVTQALGARTAAIEQLRRQKRTFVRNNGLHWGEEERRVFLSQIPMKRIDELDTPYPPFEKCIAETKEIADKWEEHLRTGYQPDARTRRLGVVVVEEHKLSHVVKENESVFLEDSHGRLFGGVIWGALSEELVSLGENAVKRTIPLRNNIRKEDPGKLVQIGYSSGSCSSTNFDWVQNLTGHSPAAREVGANNDLETSTIFALVWQLVKWRVPPEVHADFETYMEGTNLKGMDGNGQMVEEDVEYIGAQGPQSGNKERSQTKSLRAQAHYVKPPKGKPRKPREVRHVGGLLKGKCTVQVGSNEFVFNDMHLAPPTGVMGQNYSRSENNPQLLRSMRLKFV